MSYSNKPTSFNKNENIIDIIVRLEIIRLVKLVEPLGRQTQENRLRGFRNVERRAENYVSKRIHTVLK